MQGNVMQAVQEFIPFFSLNRLYILGTEECRIHIAFQNAEDDIAAYFVGASSYIINKYSLYSQDLEAYHMLLSMAIDGSFTGLIKSDDYHNIYRKVQNDADYMVYQKFHEAGKRNIAVFRDGNFEVLQGSTTAPIEARASMPKLYVNQEAAEELAYMLGATSSSFHKLRNG
jgi:hypothetical protein